MPILSTSSQAPKGYDTLADAAEITGDALRCTASLGVSQRDPSKCGDPFLHWPQQPSCSLQTCREEVLLLQLQMAERDSQQVQNIPEV